MKNYYITKSCIVMSCVAKNIYINENETRTHTIRSIDGI